MSCEKPKYAILINTDTTKTGKKIIFKSRPGTNLNDLIFKYGEKNVLEIPCGKCNYCKLSKAKEWATRCYLESLDYPNASYFITLTYNKQKCPSKLQKKDFQEFIQKLKENGLNVRYFACGEYGSLTRRPHYHAILYNLKLDDLKFYSKNEIGDYLYTSSKLEKIWGKGYVIIGEVTEKSAGYVARYTFKKNKENITDEFLIMSKKPGIGYNYIYSHMEEILNNNGIMLKNGNFKSIFRYIYKIAKKKNIETEEIKEKNIQIFKEHKKGDILKYDLNVLDEVGKNQAKLFNEKIRRLKR